MPILYAEGIEELVAISQESIWADDTAILKDGYYQGRHVYFLYDMHEDGRMFECDRRFEAGLKRILDAAGGSKLLFAFGLASLPEPMLRFCSSENKTLMKYFIHMSAIGCPSRMLS